MRTARALARHARQKQDDEPNAVESVSHGVPKAYACKAKPSASHSQNGSPKKPTYI